jgi:hypothetical protein
MQNRDDRQKKRLFRRLVLLFTVSFLMSNGPGLYLVNKPVLVAGIPLLYLWGLGWATVQILIILYAYFKLWRDEKDEEITPAGKTRAGEGRSK